MFIIRKFGFVIGWLKHCLFNKRVSVLSFVNSNCQLSKKATIYRHARINKVSVADYSYIGKGTIIHNTNIGRFCSVSDYCVIGLPAHYISTISSSPLFNFRKNGTKSSWVSKNMRDIPFDVEIGNDVWIGYGAMIAGPVKIGNGAVVAGGAVVTKDVPPYAIVGGVPAKVIRYRFSQDVVDELDRLQWWNLPDDVLKKNLDLFQKEDITLDDLKQFKTE